MILDKTAQADFSLRVGSVYRTQAGTSRVPSVAEPISVFAREVAAVWTYLLQARAAPIGLELLPPGDALAQPLAELAFATPTGDNCTASFVTLFTSGTTGAPKSARHDLAALFQSGRGADAGARWLLTYAPFRWAGLSVLLHVLRSSATLIVPATLEPEALVAAAKSDSATHVSLTPSYLRRLQLAVGDTMLRTLPLSQITFGGELATQPVLDTAHRLWPNARVTHVYATTETGDICSVSDGLAGIPQPKLQGHRFFFDTRGQLIINGHPTGDLWELRNGRYHFLGRIEELINVGGAKVSPIEVETAAMSLHGVIEAQAYAIPSLLLGQVIGLDYCGEPDENQLRKLLSARLRKLAWPAVVRRVERIELTDAGKTRRVKGAS